MKIKCTNNHFFTKEKSTVYDFIDIQKEYVVYGMIIYKDNLLFYICDQVHNDFPVAIPKELFEIVDNSISRYWVFSYCKESNTNPSWLFKEWANDIYFQDRLTDGYYREENIFKVYKELMDLEFPDPSIILKANIGDDEWLICPICIDAWKNRDTNVGMVRCPTCKEIMHNPRYEKRLIEFDSEGQLI